MKRDMKLVREVLLAVESDESLPTVGRGLLVAVDGASEDLVGYHVRLLVEGGYLLGAETLAGAVPLVLGLTWKGHDFLDATRPKGIWEIVLAAAGKVGSASIDMAFEAAKELAKQQLRSATGLV